MSDPFARWFQRVLESLLHQPPGPATSLDRAKYPSHLRRSSTRRHTTRAQRVRVRKAQHLARR